MLLRNAGKWLHKAIAVFCVLALVVENGPPALAAEVWHAGSGIHREILGDAVDYGIVAGTFTLDSGDAQTNVAAQVGTSRTQTGNDLTNPVEQPFILARVHDTFRIKGFDAHVRTNVDDADKVVGMGSTKVTTDTSSPADELHVEVADLLGHVERQSALLAERPADAEVVYHGPSQKYVLDVQGRGPGTFFANVDPMTYGAISREASKLQIRKDDGQTVVLNVAGSPNVLHKFDINGRGADSYLDKNAGSMPETIVWNLHDAETLGIRGSVTGVVIAPKATVSVEATSSGWLVAKNVNIGSGEWHNVNQQVRPVRPGMPDVPEQPGTPEQPETPEQPGTPEQPDMPESPEVPETPEDPEQPGTPERPGDTLYPEGDSSGSDESQPEPKVVLRARKVTANEDARPLEGSTYGLWRRGDDGEGTHVASDISDSDGYLYFELPTTERATYYLVEEQAPFGYLLNPYPTDPVTFGVDEQGPFLVFAENPDAEPVRPVWDERGEVATFDYLPTRNPVADEPVTLAVEKLDRDTLSEVAGAQLQLVDKESSEVVEEWVSGDEEHVLSGVLHTDRTYVLRETAAPAGYQVADEVELVLRSEDVRTVGELVSGASTANGEANADLVTLDGRDVPLVRLYDAKVLSTAAVPEATPDVPNVPTATTTATATPLVRGTIPLAKTADATSVLAALVTAALGLGVLILSWSRRKG